MPIFYNSDVLSRSAYNFETKINTQGKRIKRGVSLLFSYAKESDTGIKVKISPISSKDNLFKALEAETLREDVEAKFNKGYVWSFDIYLYGGFEGKFISNEEKPLKIKQSIAFKTPPFSRKIMYTKYFVLTFDLDDQLKFTNPRIIPVEE